ncbi:putative Monoterpene epsilon-lactone hydrolase [Seiridium unicorne]|uniref:Monoterpene epsilon-lactone hydrolase n=1 Tax=Seiridium unicorne TaxID=138068 RepID=A0ABR2V478_9PEZI
MPSTTKTRGHTAGRPVNIVRDIADLVYTLALIFPLVFTTLAKLVLRRWSNATDLSVGEDIKLSMLRNLEALPGSVKRRLMKSDTESVVNSPRFRGIRPRLQIEVSRPGFEGYWLYKAPQEEPSRRNVVLFWIHGGGYAIGDPFMGFILLLRVVELAAEQAISLSIFSLDYTLAPHAQFPEQQQEALAAYRYLLEDQGIDAGSIILGGESAGTHMALTALLGLDAAGLPKPGAALLLWPWVNLKNTGASFVRNKYKDMVSKSLYDQCVALAVGPNGQEKHAALIDFASASPEGYSWAEILPNITRLNIGSHDLFVDDAGLFVDQAKKDGANIHLEVSTRMTHGWQMLSDMPNEKAYLAMSPDSQVAEGFLPGSENVATHLIEIVNSKGV